MSGIDTCLDDQVTSAINESPYLTRQNLRHETHDGCVTLRGVVGSYYQKQMAQEALRRVEGIERIENRLEVNWV